MFLFILATIFTVGVIRCEANTLTSCPDIQSESITGVEGHWYMVYASTLRSTVRCTFSDMVNKGSNHFESTVKIDMKDNSPSQTMVSDIKKDTDGKYYDTWIDKGEVKKDPVMLKIEGDFLLEYLCVDYKNGTIFEHASIHSKTKEKSEAIKTTFHTMLNAKNSQYGQFYEQPLTDCSG
uniref:Venom protein n=1 Tax=Hemiscolopendra marginata TaxID=943146 RepID=A0A646QDF2_9MYRI